MGEISPGLYQHYKGGKYRVLSIGKIEATLDDVVVYKSLQHKDGFPSGYIWVRPYKVFTETVEHHGRTVPRFQKITTPPSITLSDIFQLTWFPFLVFMADITIIALWPAWEQINHIDIYLHFFGGISIAYSSAYALGLLEKFGVVKINNRLLRALQIIALVSLTAFLWEIFEWYVDLTRDTNFQASLFDTMKDMTLGTLGGLLFSLTTLFKKSTN